MFIKSGVYIKGLITYWKWLLPFLIANTKVAAVAGIWRLAASFIVTKIVVIVVIQTFNYWNLLQKVDIKIN